MKLTPFLVYAPFLHFQHLVEMILSDVLPLLKPNQYKNAQHLVEMSVLISNKDIKSQANVNSFDKC